MGAGAATIASAGAAIGIGNVLSSSIHSVARNPSLAKQLFGYAILGFALTEAIASFAPMMAFLISFVFQWEEDRWERAEREQSKFQWWAVFAVPFHRLFLGKSRSNRSQGCAPSLSIIISDAPAYWPSVSRGHRRATDGGNNYLPMTR
ncbi:hypothetical protein RDI58_014305 [Solanum bulbocastanum]